MDALSAIIITKALDGLSLRAAATAQNIAGANSRDTRTMRVDFEASLRAAASRGADAVRAVTPAMTAVAGTRADQETRVDLELATASETGLRYSALLDLLGRELQIERTIVRGGQ